MNVLVLGARIIGSALAFEIVDRFVAAKFIATEDGLCGASRRCWPLKRSTSAETRLSRHNQARRESALEAPIFPST